MNTTREKLLKILEDLADQDLKKLLDYAECIQEKQKNVFFAESSSRIERSMEQWDNDIDEEVWNYL